MDSVILPLGTPQVSALGADKNLTGVIDGLIEQTGNEKLVSGQSAMLEVLMSAHSEAQRTLSGKISLMLNGRLLQLPTELKLDMPIKLPDNTGIANFELKLQPQKDGGVAVRVLSVNGENPEKYLLRTSENPLPSTSSSPLIKNAAATLPPLETAPLRAKILLENLASNLKLPAEKLQPLLKEFANFSSRISVAVNQPNVLPQNSQSTEPLPLTGANADKQTFASQPLQNIQNIISDFAAGKSSLPDAARHIGKELSALAGQTFAAEIVRQSDNAALSIRAPFAEILIENQVKLGNKLPVLVALEGFERNLPLFDDVVEMSSSAVLPSSSRRLPADNILKILQPLISRGQQELAAAVMNRIPEPSSPRMLANIVAYIKAAGEHNLSRWLGSEIVDKLSATTEGREVVSKLGSMFVSSTQDNINWRIMEVPILNGQNLSKIRIAVKKIFDEEEKKKRRENRRFGTRFVVDTSFSRLGSLQFDGYALAKDRRFDLIIRTERDIGSDFCANIMRLFKNTLNDEGYVGTLKINVKEKFIKICDNDAESQILANGIYV